MAKLIKFKGSESHLDEEREIVLNSDHISFVEERKSEAYQTLIRMFSHSESCSDYVFWTKLSVDDIIKLVNN